MDRPINEYECAFGAALMDLTIAIARRETSRDALATRFRESSEASKMMGRKNEAAFLDILARLAQQDEWFVPTPPFDVIKGGKQ